VSEQPHLNASRYIQFIKKLGPLLIHKGLVEIMMHGHAWLMVLNFGWSQIFDSSWKNTKNAT
jgi:hypothetical protein